MLIKCDGTNRCLAIAKSHAALSAPKNALALFSRALDVVPMKTSQSTNSGGSAKPLRLDISDSQLHNVTSTLQSLVWQYRGIVEVDNLSAKMEEAKSAIQPPLIERLDDYPHGGCDLSNLVDYPPRIQPVPVKPVFLDVAFNYIEYPTPDKKAGATDQEMAEQKAAPEVKKEPKRGWFGFGR